MKVVTSEEMREIDRKTIREYGIAGRVLMERAGLAVASKVKEIFELRKVIVLAGGGNNGGDGIVAARNLHSWGWNVKVLLLTGQNNLSPDCLAQYKTAKKIGLPVEFRKKIDKKDLHSAVVIDAIFGIGLNKDVKKDIEGVILSLNKSNAPVISVDTASGISSDTGRIMGAAVMADYTVTFGLPKRGHLLYPGAEHTGKLFVEDIGFPGCLLKSDKLRIKLLEKGDMSLLIPERRGYSHKGNYGHVLIVAGSKGKTGAAFMSAKSCLRAGAGIVTMGVPESLIDIFQSRVTEEMTLPLPDRGDGTLSAKASEKILEFLSEKADVLAVGPGISNTGEIQKLISTIVLGSTAPMIVDADAINALSAATSKGQGAKGVLRKAKAPIVLTPHPGEMARLLQASDIRHRVSGRKIRDEIENDRIDTAINFSKATGTYVVLKGAPTIIAGPGGNAYINPTGNPGMASAGAGDVLTGMVAAFMGQGLNPLEASILGVYMHGLAGDLSASKKGEHALIASDIIKAIPETFRAMRE